MAPLAPDEQGKPTPSSFVTTHWSIVLAAGNSASPRASDALEHLCRAYWYPLYTYIRRSGRDEETAKDLTQGFFERFLEKNYLKDVDRQCGRFRSFLLASLKHFLANEWDRQRAQRRGGGFQFVSLDEKFIQTCEHQDSALSVSPDKMFERRWPLALLDIVRRRLHEEYAAAGKANLFAALRIYLSGERDAPPYLEIARSLNLSVEAVKKTVQRLRRRYGELLREEIAQTVAHPSEIEDEIRCLKVALQP
jgi:DNA-directed RNA polymerase specialized sigma24 family protein